MKPSEMRYRKEKKDAAEPRKHGKGISADGATGFFAAGNFGGEGTGRGSGKEGGSAREDPAGHGCRMA